MKSERGEELLNKNATKPFEYALLAVIAFSVGMYMLDFLFGVSGKVEFLGNTIPLYVVTSIPGLLSFCVYSLSEFRYHKKKLNLAFGIMFLLDAITYIYRLFFG